MMHLGYESRWRTHIGKWSAWEPVNGGVIDEIHDLFGGGDASLSVKRVEFNSGGMSDIRQWRRAKS